MNNPDRAKQGFNFPRAALSNAIGWIIGDNAIGLFTHEQPSNFMANYKVESAIPREIAIGVIAAGLQYLVHKHDQSSQESTVPSNLEQGDIQFLTANNIDPSSLG
jgi:hypothetical protein